MPVAVDYDLTMREAEKALQAARTADDIRNTWKKYNATLGHRTLGRLLLGRRAADLVAKHTTLAQCDPGGNGHSPDGEG